VATRSASERDPHMKVMDSSDGFFEMSGTQASPSG
jgi:hypothetical protein